MTSSLTALIDMAREPSSEKRRELLREITNVFMVSHDQVSDSEMGLYGDVLEQLNDEMEQAVRAELAQRLSCATRAPHGLLRKLASDHINVAEPILVKSRVLSESDLLHVVSTKGQDHLRAVSRREEVSEAVADVIVDRGDDHTLHTLLSNEGARLSRVSSEQVVGRAQSNPILHEVVVERKDLPIDLMNEMYFVVEARLRERILAENARTDPTLIEAALARGSRLVAVAHGIVPPDFEKLSAEITTLREQGKLTPSLLARFMREAEPTRILIALSQLADIDYVTAKHLVERREVDALAIACKAAGLDKALFLTYAMIVMGQNENTMGKAKEYGQLYGDLPRETAMRTIRFWRVRRVESMAA